MSVIPACDNSMPCHAHVIPILRQFDADLRFIKLIDAGRQVPAQLHTWNATDPRTCM